MVRVNEAQNIVLLVTVAKEFHPYDSENHYQVHHEKDQIQKLRYGVDCDFHDLNSEGIVLNHSVEHECFSGSQDILVDFWIFLGYLVLSYVDLSHANSNHETFKDIHEIFGVVPYSLTDHLQEHLKRQTKSEYVVQECDKFLINESLEAEYHDIKCWAQIEEDPNFLQTKYSDDLLTKHILYSQYALNPYDCVHLVERFHYLKFSEPFVEGKNIVAGVIVLRYDIVFDFLTP